VREARGASWAAEIEQTAYVEEATSVTARRGGESVGTGAFINVPEIILPIALAVGDPLVLTRVDAPGQGAERAADGIIVTPAQVHCTLAAAFECARPGHAVWFDDGKIGGVVAANDGERITVTITRTGPKGAKLRAEKGVMAECAMLNKGPKIVETVRFLADIIDRMDEHYSKQRATLRRLAVADLEDLKGGN